MKFAVLSLLFVSCIASVAQAKDPVFAVPTNPRDTTAVNSYDARYSIVNLSWFKYLFGYASNGNFVERTPKFVFFVVKNTPDNLIVNYTESRSSRRLARRLRGESDKSRFILGVAERVLRDYMDLMKVRNYRLFPNRVDPRGVTLQRTNNSNDGSFLFNRTFVLSFEDPPYGQSLPNRVVTNVRTEWTINLDTLSSSYNRTIDSFEMPNVRDLRYRYYHNFGHALGYGHFQGFFDYFVSRRNPRDVSRSSVDRDNYGYRNQRVNRGYARTRSQVRERVDTLNDRRVNTYGRSVMFADTKNRTHASNHPTRLDQLLLPLIAKNSEKIIVSFGNVLIGKLLPERIYSLYETFRYFV